VSRWRSTSGLQTEVVTSLALVVLAGLAVVGLGMAAMSLRAAEREATERLRLGARQLERLASAGPARLADLGALIRALPREELPTQWWLLGPEGRLLGRSGPDVERVPAVWTALAPQERASARLIGGGFPPDDLVLAAPLTGRSGETGVLVGRVRREVLLRRALPMLSLAVWGLSFTAVIFVAFGAWLLRHRIVLPVQSVSEAARRIGSGDLAARIDVVGNDELAALGRHFNRMAESLMRERDALLEAQRRLLHSERLTAAGRLASGVAHEVGNPTAAILGYVELALRDPDLPPRIRETQERLRDEALRVRALIREMLDLARSSHIEVEPVDPAELLQRTAERLRSQPLLARVALDVTGEPGLGAIHADAARVEQILVNLIENGAHALAGQREPAPRIELRARRSEPPGHPARRRDDAARIALDVVDNGPGIEADHLSLVFEPFFTTKDPGRGTGLGLWNAHRLAELLGGSLEVASRPGRTAFSLLLPVADSRASDGESAAPDHR
jgi:signal transduction histidine kinase